jgi:hypothetical protein
MTVTPETVFVPLETVTETSAGRITSTRDPNRIIPNRTPALTASPAFSVQTILLARNPAT